MDRVTSRPRCLSESRHLLVWCWRLPQPIRNGHIALHLHAWRYRALYSQEMMSHIPKFVSPNIERFHCCCPCHQHNMKNKQPTMFFVALEGRTARQNSKEYPMGPLVWALTKSLQTQITYKTGAHTSDPFKEGAIGNGDKLQLLGLIIPFRVHQGPLRPNSPPKQWAPINPMTL